MAKKREPDNIDRDCMRAMALGYGVHYGRFKADYPHTADRDEVVPQYPPRICPQCGTEFLPGRDNQKYCSEECKYEFNRIHRMRNPMRARQPFCKRCGAPVIDPKQRVYCSKACMTAYDVEKRRGNRGKK